MAVWLISCWAVWLAVAGRLCGWLWLEIVMKIMIGPGLSKDNSDAPATNFVTQNFGSHSGQNQF